SVTAYGASAKSDSNGEFTLRAILSAKDRIVVSFQRDGFFDRTAAVRDTGGTPYMKVVMIPRESIGVVDVQTGGIVGSDAVSVTVGPSSFVGSDGSDASGTAEVYVGYANPGGGNFGETMPGGDFIGEDGSGNRVLLVSYGAFYIEAEDAAGDQLLPLDCATVSVRIPGSIGSAPQSSTLWQLGGNSIWTPLGAATRIGNRYEFCTSVFGALNVDDAWGIADIHGRVCDEGDPVPSTRIVVGQIVVYTGSEGYYAASVPAGVILAISSEYGEKTFGPLDTDSSTEVNFGECKRSIPPIFPPVVDGPEPGTTFRIVYGSCSDADLNGSVLTMVITPSGEITVVEADEWDRGPSRSYVGSLDDFVLTYTYDGGDGVTTFAGGVSGDTVSGTVRNKYKGDPLPPWKCTFSGTRQ
ncbi:MAG: hypothetical protein HQ559_12255, partial [Lentisphaerae bacterium]|nr:hypothetical protein [Lentisphaerota bacterium]